jgi:hypothetical protein
MLQQGSKANMTIGTTESHPEPTSLQPREYALFFIPRRLVGECEGFFANLDEPDEYFRLVPAMRVEQLAWRPGRIERSDVRALADQRGGLWLALTKASQAAQLRTILSEHGLY